MKKQISAIVIAGAACILGGLSVYSNQAADAALSGVGKTAEYSDLLSESYTDVNDFYHETLEPDGLSDDQVSALENLDTIYEVGDNIAISTQEVEQYTEFYINSGMTQEDAEAEARKDAEERAALYVEAIRNGYTVTDEEIYEWLDELKSVLEEDNNMDAYQAAMSGFDSEEAYWDYEYQIYTVDLPIQKYAQAKEQEFYQENPDAGESDIAYNSWYDAYQELKAELAAKQNFR